MHTSGATDLLVIALFSQASSQMKKIEAHVPRDKLCEVDSALRSIGVPGLTFAEEDTMVRGMWSYPADKVKHVTLTVVVDDGAAGRVVRSIMGSGSTSSWPDGRISVTSLDGVYDISSGSIDPSELVLPPVNS